MKIKNVFLLLAMFYVFVTGAQAAAVNVTDFGAVGDSYTDNQAFIQSAITSLGSGGGTVYFPPGLYNVNGTINVPSNIRLQGLGSSVYSYCQIRLNPTDKALFNVENGASNVVFKDLVLLANSRQDFWPRNSTYETGLIRTENTTGIAFEQGEEETSNIVIENVRITQFTYGISTRFYPDSIELPSELPSEDPNATPITDVKIRNYASDGNEYSLHTDTKGADNWDVQNMNVYPMFDQQNGVFLERSGDMRFLQLSCANASAGVNANICAKLWDNGNIYFRQMHIEGPRLGICAGDNCDTNDPVETIEENRSRITIENSATNGEFNRETDLVSINNRFSLASPPALPPPVYTFNGTGTYSPLRSCGDVWLSPGATHDTLTTVVIPSNPPSPALGVFPGLPNDAPTYGACLRSDLTSVPVFNTGYEPDNERLSDAEIDVTGFIHNYIIYSATANDGIDDSAVFQAAIDESMEHGKRVYVPPGTFDINTTLNFHHSSTVAPYEGVTILGEAGSIINLNGSNLSLFKIINGNGYATHAVTLRNLELVAQSDTGTIGIKFENFSSSTLGAASDYMIQNVDFSGFEIGLAVLPVGGVWTNSHPMFDSVSVKDGDFNGNKTAMLIESTNASNWNLEDIRVDIPNGKEGVRVNGGGVSVRNLSCTSAGTGTACMTIQRTGVVPIENLTASDVTNALLVPWENGGTHFPVSVRNSNLIEGVYFQGITYLNSVNNIYPASRESDMSPFPKAVRFAAMYEGNPANTHYGGQSQVFTCDDTFTNLIFTQSTWIYSGTLLTPETYCY